jgi:fimbrial chaperone protein
MWRMGLALVVALPVRSATINIAPVIIELSPESRTALVAIKNEGVETVRVQLTVHAWQEGTDGKIVLSPTSEMELFPPLLSLAAGERRNIRIAAAGAPGAPVEKAYRLIIDELPSPLPPARGLRIPTLTRLSLPVFLAPAARVVEAGVGDVALRGGVLSFALRNHGTVRVRPRAVALRALDATGGTVVDQRWDGWYLLAGGSRRYEVRLAPADCARIASVSVEAPGDEAAIASTWRPPGGGCGR